MRIFVKLFIFSIMVIVLASCSEKQYQPIPENLSIAATINIKEMSVSFIDLGKLEKQANWTFEKPYTGGFMLPDHDTLLLYGKEVETADLYSLKLGQKVASWNIGKGIVNGKLLQNRKEIVLVDQNQSAVRFFNFEGKELTQVKTALSPYTMIESEKGHKLYVLSFQHEKVTVINSVEKEKAAEFPIHPSATGAWLIDDRDELWVGGHGIGAEIEQDIHVYDTNTGDFMKPISVPSMPVYFLGHNDHIYVLSHGSNKLYQLTESGEVLSSNVIGANPFAMIAVNQQLLVAGYDSNDLHIVNPENLKIRKTIEVGGGPFQLILRESKE